MKELTRNWRKLSLSEEEGRNMDLTKNKKWGRMVLAAKFFTRRSVNIEAVARTFRPLWRTRRDFEVNDAGNNYVLFEFELEADVEKVLMGEPWSYDRHLVVLDRYDGSTPIQNLSFSTTSFWIQIHDLPYSLLNTETALTLGESLGTVTKPKDLNKMRGCNFMRVRVAVDITKPLCRGRRVTWDQTTDGWASFKYERLPNLCYWCGMLSHDDRDCELWFQSKGSLSVEDRQFGAWIRASQYNPARKASVKVQGFDVSKPGSSSQNILNPTEVVTTDHGGVSLLRHQQQPETEEEQRMDFEESGPVQAVVSARNNLVTQSVPDFEGLIQEIDDSMHASSGILNSIKEKMEGVLFNLESKDNGADSKGSDSAVSESDLHGFPPIGEMFFKVGRTTDKGVVKGLVRKKGRPKTIKAAQRKPETQAIITEPIGTNVILTKEFEV